MQLPLKRDVPKSPFRRTSTSGAIGRHAVLGDRPFSVSHHHLLRTVRAASAVARCVTSGEQR
jgi:hypothetical protein